MLGAKKRTRVTVAALWLMAAAAFVTSAGFRHRMPEDRLSFTYLPIGDEQASYDGWALLSVLDSRLWFGIATGLVIAGVVVALIARSPTSRTP